MPDVFEVLRADHAAVEQMLAALENSPGHSAGAGSTVLAARKEVAQRLVIDSSQHEAAEEQYFWPAVRQRLASGGDLADQAIAQEQEAREALARLDKLDAGRDEFDQVIAGFIPAARRHIEFEETRVWPGLRDALSSAEARELGDKLSQARELGPTRPHPHTPASPGVLKTAGQPSPSWTGSATPSPAEAATLRSPRPLRGGRQVLAPEGLMIGLVRRGTMTREADQRAAPVRQDRLAAAHAGRRGRT